MKYDGEARRAAFKIIMWTLGAIVLLAVTGYLSVALGHIMVWVAQALIFIWILFVLFTLYFFRDPDAHTPDTPGIVVSPGHGKVDLIHQCEEPVFMGGKCHRISIFLSVIDVHVQNAPVTGKVAYLQHTSGQFLSAVSSDCSLHNENVLLGFNSTETPGERIGLRLIAGLIARRIVPFVKVGDGALRGERISLIQFGSRCDLYLPLHYKVRVRLGDKVVGGESVMAVKT